MGKRYNAEEQFDLLLEKMNLSDKKIDDSERVELIELYDQMFKAVRTKFKELFPFIADEELNEMTGNLLMVSTKNSVLKPEITFSTN